MERLIHQSINSDQVYLVVRPGESIVLRTGDQLQQVQGNTAHDNYQLQLKQVQGL